MKIVKYKGKTIHPYESFYWNTTESFNRGELGGGVARSVKCDNSLATLVMEDVKVQQVMNIVGDTKIGFKNPQIGRVYSVDGLSPCLDCYGGGGREPKVLEEKNIIEPTIMAMRGRKENGNYQQKMEWNDTGTSNALTSVQKDNLVVEPTKMQAMVNNALLTKDISYGDTYNPYNDTLDKSGISPTLTTRPEGNKTAVLPVVPNDKWNTIIGNKQLNPFRGSVDGTSPCITSACGMGGGMTPMLTDADLETTKQKEFIEQIRGHKEMKYRIRKLTPKECFRLMGVDDADIEKIQSAGLSNSAQYKLAGNSIVTDVLYHIFRKAFCERDNEAQQMTFF